MGTNYYLVRADSVDVVCNSCGSNPTSIHIGKGSIGWVFAWRGYRPSVNEWDAEPPASEDLDLDTPTKWFAFLDERCTNGWIIRDEYDRTKELSEFRSYVERKRGGHTDDGSYGARPDRRVVGGDEVCFYQFS